MCFRNCIGHMKYWGYLLVMEFFMNSLYMFLEDHIKCALEIALVTWNTLCTNIFSFLVNNFAHSSHFYLICRCFEFICRFRLLFCSNATLQLQSWQEKTSSVWWIFCVGIGVFLKKNIFHIPHSIVQLLHEFPCDEEGLPWIWIVVCKHHTETCLIVHTEKEDRNKICQPKPYNEITSGQTSIFCQRNLVTKSRLRQVANWRNLV